MAFGGGEIDDAAGGEQDMRDVDCPPSHDRGASRDALDRAVQDDVDSLVFERCLQLAGGVRVGSRRDLRPVIDDGDA